jgi:hypothetical protein
MSSAFDFGIFTTNSTGNIFFPCVVYMCDMELFVKGVTFYSPESVTLLQYPVHLTFDLLTPKSTANIFLPWVVYMCNMVCLDGKGSIPEP